MKNFLKIFCIAVLLSMTSNMSLAQLPVNPWTPQAPKPNSGYFGENVGKHTNGGDITNAPVYQTNSGGGEILPVDPWARSRDTSGIRTWRGSGQQGKLNYIGEGTTFGEGNGDMEHLAPEVNRHNMVVMLDHLRKLGYKIPKSYDEKVQNMPAKYKSELRESINDVNSADDPLSRVFVGMIKMMEDATGLDANNILFNTADLLGTD